MKTKEEIEKKLKWVQSADKKSSGKEAREGYELALLWVLDLDIG